MARRQMISSLPQAFEVIKEMDLSTKWDTDYRHAVRGALVSILEERMRNRVDPFYFWIPACAGMTKRTSMAKNHLRDKEPVLAGVASRHQSKLRRRA